jgi:glutaredoxin
MDITIYTTLGCSYCTTIKELMDRANVEYTAILVGKDMLLEEFRNLYPKAAGFPYCIIDDVPVGGLMETAKYFTQRGLVSSKKNE